MIFYFSYSHHDSFDIPKNGIQTNYGAVFKKSSVFNNINFVKKSLQIELDLFFKNIKGKKTTITKQSFSEARLKILPEAFIKMFYAIVKWYYQDDDFKKYKGYRLSAIDGSIIELNNSKQLQDAYGYEKNDHKITARALASGIYDLENEIMVAAKITRCKYGERKAATELLDELISMG